MIGTATDTRTRRPATVLTGLLLTATALTTVAPSATAATTDRGRRTSMSTLTLTPTATEGAPVTATGKVSTRFRRAVQLQLRTGTAWRAVASSRTSSRGAFAVADTVVRGGSYRVYLPRVRVRHRAYAAVVSATRLAVVPNELAPGAALVGGQVVSSADKVYDLTMTTDGNLTLTRHDTPGTIVWSSATGGHPGARAVMQDAGNLVVVDAANQLLWSTGTATPGSRLQVLPNGTLAVVSDLVPLWTSTAGLLPVPTSDALTRAGSWVAAGVKYSQSKYYANAYGSYRTDCSGFVSMAWALSSSYTTRTLGQVAHAITAAELTTGDVLLSAVRHVVLFDSWVDATHTSYYGYEESPGPGAVRRAIPYPYFKGNNPASFLPFRRN